MSIETTGVNPSALRRSPTALTWVIEGPPCEMNTFFISGRRSRPGLLSWRLRTQARFVELEASNSGAESRNEVVELSHANLAPVTDQEMFFKGRQILCGKTVHCVLFNNIVFRVARCDWQWHRQPYRKRRHRKVTFKRQPKTAAGRLSAHTTDILVATWGSKYQRRSAHPKYCLAEWPISLARAFHRDQVGGIGACPCEKSPGCLGLGLQIRPKGVPLRPDWPRGSFLPIKANF